MDRAKQKRMIALIAIVFGIMLALPLVNAVVTWRTPTVGTNQSTTMIVNITLAAADCSACHNATIYYNASGGPAIGGTVLTAILNDTANDIEFYSASISISGLADAATYNFTARLYNGTGNVANATSARFTIDNTKPTGSMSCTYPSVSINGAQKCTWTSSDLTSGVKTSTMTFTSPNTDRCATQTSSSSSGTLELVGSEETGCTGTYTLALALTDYAGNTFSPTSATFKVTEFGFAGGSGGTAGGVAVGTGAIGTDAQGKLNPKIVGIALIIILIYFALRKK